MTAIKKRWALWGAGLGVAASISGAAVYFESFAGANAAPDAAAAPPPAQVTVAEITPREVTTWEEFSGRLEAIDRVQVRSRVAGAIQSVHFREGALVKEGDLLVTIDPASFEAAVARAEGEVASAQARLELAGTELDRGRKLSDNRTISQSDLDQRRSAYNEAQAALSSAKAALKTATLDLGYTQVRAPISGRVGRLEITVGNLVAAGSASPALTTLVSVDPIYASFNATEATVSRALRELPSRDGSPEVDRIPVEIGTVNDEGTPIKGKLQLIDNEVDAASGTVRVRAIFDNPGGRLLPGQFVRVRMGQPSPEKRLLVSERAIGTDLDKKFVFVVDADNTVAYRQVHLGAAIDGMRIVEDGLNAGDRIVVNGLQRIRSGAVVDPTVEDKVAATQ
ncbi:efflux RND transporter periplasmic adaptor subunit [Rhizobiaceae bacterium n13]|uniref:Efflux RND transporter periplasmic adaptor subunit n=1 Tax=Ferirhizobium litorale TaxID=2927786 RepID=A0AAE3QEV0_9HYPH|nr:efflux RND transporter periplasmic adaptor subunit [Fererhizobium litorale]MDI7862085.1 efflux RND transporter periplasmic adaptor subunit [Fererhizobium litorale]MDI7922643.1 efflux RND transporter periplasmic adaptor subunit [Fererhizobium litorale]